MVIHLHPGDGSTMTAHVHNARTSTENGLISRLRIFVRALLSKPSIVVESAEAPRFTQDDKWDETAQTNLDRLYDETLDALQENAEEVRTKSLAQRVSRRGPKP